MVRIYRMVNVRWPYEPGALDALPLLCTYVILIYRRCRRRRRVFVLNDWAIDDLVERSSTVSKKFFCCIGESNEVCYLELSH